METKNVLPKYFPTNFKQEGCSDNIYVSSRHTQNLCSKKSQSIQKNSINEFKLGRKKSRNAKDLRVTRSLNLNIHSDSFEMTKHDNIDTSCEMQSEMQSEIQSATFSKENQAFKNSASLYGSDIFSFDGQTNVQKNENFSKMESSNAASKLREFHNNKLNFNKNCFLKTKPCLNILNFKNKVLFSNQNTNFKSQEMIVSAFNFFLNRKFGLHNTRKMIDVFSEEEKQIKLIRFNYRVQENCHNDTSSTDLNSSVNEAFGLFKNLKLKYSMSSDSSIKNKSHLLNNDVTNVDTGKERTLINNSSTKASSLAEAHLKTSAFSTPHFKKAKKGGEDAFKFNETFLIVADGVGGWNNKGVDPALFSKTLVENLYSELSKEYKKVVEAKDISLHIRTILQRAIDSTVSIEGSSTISLILFDLIDRKAYSAYIGDSIYLIARLNPKTLEYELVYVCKEQIHGFNLPYQVGKQCDTSSAACITEHEIHHRDIFIVATDGLWDNLSLDVIVNTINQVKNSSNEINTKQLSELLTKKAQVISFNKKAQKYHILLPGGKIDDITVICSQVEVTGKNNGNNSSWMIDNKTNSILCKDEYTEYFISKDESNV